MHLCLFFFVAKSLYVMFGCTLSKNKMLIIIIIIIMCNLCTYLFLQFNVIEIIIVNEMKLLQHFFSNGLPWFDKKKSTTALSKQCSPEGDTSLGVKYQAPSDHVTDGYASVTLAVASMTYDSNSRYWSSADDSYLDAFSRSSLIHSNHCLYPSPEFISSAASFTSSSSSAQCSLDGEVCHWRTMDPTSRHDTHLTGGGGGSDGCDSGVMIGMLTRSESTNTITATRLQDAFSVTSGHSDQLRNVTRSRNTNDVAENADTDSFTDELLSNVFPILDDEDGNSTMRRTVNEISSSLAANLARLRRDKRAVEDTFSRARSQERQKARELARIRRQVFDARRDILLGTLKQLKKELERQCLRLQAAYDTVLSVRWRQLHTVGQTSTGLLDIHSKHNS